jgi:hypothetical protein
MQTSGQFHILAALLPRTETSVRSYEGRKMDMNWLNRGAILVSVRKGYPFISSSSFSSSSSSSSSMGQSILPYALQP